MENIKDHQENIEKKPVNLINKKLTPEGKHSRPVIKPNRPRLNIAISSNNIILCIILLVMFGIIAFTKADALNNITIIVFILAELIACVLPSKQSA